MMGIGAASLAAVAAGVAVGVSQSTSQTSVVAGPVNRATAPEKTAPFTAGRYVTITFTAGDSGATLVGNPKSKILVNTPFGTALAPKAVKEGYHFVCWTKTVEGEEVEVRATEVVAGDLEVHARMAKDISAIHIVGEDRQFTTLNYNAGTDSGVGDDPVTDGTGVLDYHIYDADNNEITEADSVEWEVLEGDVETEYAEMIPATGETWATFRSVPSASNWNLTLEITIRATVVIGDSELVAELPVTLIPPPLIGYKSITEHHGEVERILPSQLYDGDNNTQVAWIPHFTDPDDSDSFDGWAALDMQTVYDEPDEGTEVVEPIKGWYWTDGSGTATDFTIARDKFNPEVLALGATHGTAQYGQTATIGDYFLRNCTALNPATMCAWCGPHITAIGDSFMEGCTSLKRFGDFFNSEQLGISRLTSIGDNFLADCTAFEDTFFLQAENCTPAIGEIGDFFMMNCTGYTRGTFLTNVNKIGQYFMYNSGVFGVELGEKTGFVGNHFLEKCNGLEGLTFHCSPAAFEHSDFTQTGTLTTLDKRETPVKIYSDYSELTDTPVDDFLKYFPSFAMEAEVAGDSSIYRQLAHGTAVVTQTITVTDPDVTADPEVFTEGTTTGIELMGELPFTVSSIRVNGNLLINGTDYKVTNVTLSGLTIKVINLSKFAEGAITIETQTL